MWLRSAGGCGPCGGDGFESGVDTEGAKETADVVPDRLGAQMELGGDLLRRAALLEKTQHLDLTGGEMRGWLICAVVEAFFEQSEDADHPFTVLQRDGAHLYGTRVPVLETRWPVASLVRAVPSIF